MRTARAVVAVIAPVLAVTSLLAGAVVPSPRASAHEQAQAQALELEHFLGLPLTNRLADVEPGGVHRALPTNSAHLGALVEQARAAGRPETSYAALLLQYRLVQATEEAGIDLATWNPFDGFTANRSNMLKSYRYYQDFQLARRELQWAGMGGQVGGDFGGGIADIEWVTRLYDAPGLQQAAREVFTTVEAAFGPEAVAQLPGGLRVLAERAGDITTEDLYWFVTRVVIMQKAIFSDLMPMHHVYVHEGLPGLEEMHRAGLFPGDIMGAWYDIASGDPDRIASGNATLLNREQGWVVAGMWDEVRDYEDGLGEAFTFLMTLAGSPSVAGVPPLRNHRPITVSGVLPDGRPATLHTPLPGWDWSRYEERWDYVSSQLLPRYRHESEHNWPALEATLRLPYEQQFEAARATSRIPQILDAVARPTYTPVP